MIHPPPHNLINEKQIADMTRGQLGDTNMNPQQLLYLAGALGMPRPSMVPSMMVNGGNRKHGRVENIESLPKAKRARLNTQYHKNASASFLVKWPWLHLNLDYHLA